MADAYSWVKKAFDMATGREAAALPLDERIMLIQRLYQAYEFVHDRRQDISGIGKAQLEKAIIDVLDTQSHTDEFKRRIDAALDNLANNDNGKFEPVLAFLAFWDKLKKGDKKMFMEGAIGRMEQSLQREFPFLRLSVKPNYHPVAAMVASERFNNELDGIKAVVAWPLSMKGEWQIAVNKLHRSSGYDNGFELMRKTTETGIHIVQEQLRFNHARARFGHVSMPYQLYEDSENIFALEDVPVPRDDMLRWAIRDALFTTRFAQERSQQFMEDLREMVEERQGRLRLPEPEKGRIARFIDSLRPKR